MKRIRTGACILLLLLAAGMFFSIHMQKVHSDISRQLRQAAQCAQNGDWQHASSQARQARQAWKKARNMTAATADQTPMDEIEGLFAQLEVYTTQQQMPDFAATCLHLAQLTETIGDTHKLNWRNLL